MYKIISDSSCDLRNLETVPLIIYSDEISFIDDENMNITAMLDAFSSYKGRTYTACPGGEAWIKALEGYDEIYIVTMTSALSGTYNSAENACRTYLEDHPDIKIKVFDSLSTGPGMCLLIEKIKELKEQGLEFDDVCRQITEYQKNTELFFALQSLHNLAQNGRINKVVASAIGVLGIRIIAKGSDTGTIEPIGKSRNDRQTIKTLAKCLRESGYKSGKIRICHVENAELANSLGKEITASYPDADIKIYPARGLVSYYAERGAILMGFER